MRRMQRAVRRLCWVLGAAVCSSTGRRLLLTCGMMCWRGRFERVVFAIPHHRMARTVTRLPPSAARSARSPLDPRAPRVCMSLHMHTVAACVLLLDLRHMRYVRTWEPPPPCTHCHSWFGLCLGCV